jgi:hypothetical protein
MCDDWRVPNCSCKECRVFYTSKGWLTKYALACGYIHKFESARGRICLWQEHGVIHVRQVNPDSSRVFWETFMSVGEARKRYQSGVKSYLLKTSDL